MRLHVPTYPPMGLLGLGPLSVPVTYMHMYISESSGNRRHRDDWQHNVESKPSYYTSGSILPSPWTLCRRPMRWRHLHVAGPTRQAHARYTLPRSDSTIMYTIQNVTSYPSRLPLQSENQSNEVVAQSVCQRVKSSMLKRR